MKVILAQGRHQFAVGAGFCANADYSYRVQKDLPGGKSIMHLHPRDDDCPDSVSALRPPHPTHVAGTYVTENGSRCLYFNVTIRGIRIAIGIPDIRFARPGYALLGELTNIPTDTLIDMLFVILAGEVTLTAKDVAEIVEIQCELQRRDERSHRNWRAVN